MKNRGFTIIELIIVIAIIGVLASIVISNAVSYTRKGKDAAIKGQVKQIMIAAIKFYAENSTYSGVCGAGTDCFTAYSNIIKLGGEPDAENSYFLSNAYCMNFYLSDKTTKWCADSTGYVGPESNCKSTPPPAKYTCS